MQEKPPMSPLVPPMREYTGDHLLQFTKKWRVSCMNSITLVCLVLFTLYAFMNIFSDGYNFSLSMAWKIASDGLHSGILAINAGTAGFSAVLCFFPLGIWGCIALKLSLKNPSAEKSLIVWTSVLLGVTAFLILSLMVFNSLPCIDQSPDGSSSVCAMPIRPGVPVPTPWP